VIGCMERQRASELEAERERAQAREQERCWGAFFEAYIDIYIAV